MLFRWEAGGNAQSQLKNLSSGDGGSGGGARGPNTENRKNFAKAKSDGVDKVGSVDGLVVLPMTQHAVAAGRVLDAT